MESFLNQNKKKEYSLEDAFHIIQSIINTEKEKYGLTIIEIKKDDGLDIHSFLEIDPNIMENKSEIIYIKTTIKTIKGRKYKI